MWRENQHKIGKLAKFELPNSSLSYQSTLDIIEGYAYSKKGSELAVHNLLHQITHLLKPFRDVDEALLLANSVVQLKQGHNGLKLTLLQKCLDFIWANES